MGWTSFLSGGSTMRRLQWRFTVRKMMLAVAVVAVGLGILSSLFNWLQYPHIEVTIFNKSSQGISDLRVAFRPDYRTAERLAPGAVARTQIQWPEEGVSFSYRDSDGTLREAPFIGLYLENRGFLEFYVTDEGVRVINGAYYSGFNGIPILGVHRLPPTGTMTIE